MLDSVAKTKMINVRLSENTHNEFKIACELRGAGMAQILHQFIVRTIREEKDREPKAFEVATKEKYVLMELPVSGDIQTGDVTPKKLTKIK